MSFPTSLILDPFDTNTPMVVAGDPAVTEQPLRYLKAEAADGRLSLRTDANDPKRTFGVNVTEEKPREIARGFVICAASFVDCSS